MPDPLISLAGVNHFFGDGALRRQVLFEVNLDVEPGGIVILTGPTGSGKTTLLTLCGGLRTVQEGSVRILGRELCGAAPSARAWVREHVGLIFQSHNLLNALTARENVGLALGLDKSLSRAERFRRADDMLESVGLADRLHYFPANLSGGEKQRVAVARALVRRPKMILADEPTASLDRKAGRGVVELLHDIARNRDCGVLLVTHDHRILDIADRVVTLEDGRILPFSSDMAAASGNMLQAFARLERSGELPNHFGSVSNRQFMRMLEYITPEFEHYLKIFQIGSSEAVQKLFDTVLEAITLKMVEVMQADRGTLYLVDRKAGLLRSRVAKGDGTRPLVIEAPVERSAAGRPVITGKRLNVPDAYACAYFNPEFDGVTGYVTRNLLCMPLFDRSGEVFAVAQLLNRKGEAPFTAKDEEQFLVFAEPIGVILAACVEARDRVAGDRAA